MDSQQNSTKTNLLDTLTKLMPLLEKIKAGDYSNSIQIPQDSDGLTQVYEALQTLQQGVTTKQKQLDEEIATNKQLQNAFYRQTQDLKALVDESPDIIARYDRELRHVYVNPTVEKITGIPASSFIGKTNKDLSIPEAQEHLWTENLNRVFETGQEARIEYWYRSPDQRIRFFQARLVPEKTKEGAVQYVFCVSHDITELRQRTEELETERVKDQAILANIGDGLVVTDDMGRIVLMNQVAQDLLQWNIKDAVGRVLTEIVPLEDEKENIISPDGNPITLALRSNRKISATFYYKKRDNTKFPVSMTVTPLAVANTIVGSIEIFRDVTHEKELDHVKDQFISLVSHELRAPMTAIKGLVSMTLNGDYGELTDRLRQPLTNVYTSAERQLHLINDLLNISRFQSSRIKYTLFNFPLNKIAEEVVASLQAQARMKRIVLTVTPSQEILVQGDDLWIKEVLNNLIANAIKFTTKGSVTVSYREDHDQAMVVITDTGTGIAGEEQEKLFGKFEQIITPTRGKAVGSGLGLYISRGVARKMGGDVYLEKSVPNQGSTFVYSIPRANTQRAQDVKSELEKTKELTLNKKYGS